MPAHPPDTRSESELYQTEIEKLFDEFAAPVYRCIHRGLSYREAEEITGSAFLALIPHWAEVRESRSPIMYVLRTALNLREDFRRKASASGRRSHDEPAEAWPGRPERDHLDLRTALSRLSPREEQLTVMRYWMYLSPDEIALTMGLHQDQVRNTLLKTRVKLAEMLSASDHQVGSDGTRR